MACCIAQMTNHLSVVIIALREYLAVCIDPIRSLPNNTKGLHMISNPAHELVLRVHGCRHRQGDFGLLDMTQKTKADYRFHCLALLLGAQVVLMEL